MGNEGARLGLTAGIGLIGALFGGPAGFAAGALVGGVVGHLLFPMDDAKAAQQKGPQLNDLAIQTSTYGNAIPITYGTVRLAGNVIWAGKLRIEKRAEEAAGGKKKKTKSGKKATGSGSYVAFLSFAIGLCRGPIVGVRRVWADDQLIWNTESPGTGAATPYTLYYGTETQLPDPTIEAEKGAGNAPGYRGLAYVVFADFRLDTFGGRVPNFHFEIVSGVGVNSGHVTTLSSGTPLLHYGGKLAFDYETGLIWVTAQRENAVKVVRPDTLEEVQRIFALSPRAITYQPECPSIEGFSLKWVPPSMVVASNLPSLLGGGMYTIRTRDYSVTTENPFQEYGDVYLHEPADVILNMPQLVDFESFKIVHVWLTFQDFSNVIMKLPVTTEGVQVPDNLPGVFQSVPATTEGGLVTADSAWLINETLGKFLYILTWMGWLIRLRPNGTKVNSIRPIDEAIDIETQGLSIDQLTGDIYVYGTSSSSQNSYVKKVKYDLSTVLWTSTIPTNTAEAYLGVSWHPMTQEVFAVARKRDGLILKIQVRKLAKTNGSVVQEFFTDYAIGINFLSDFQCYPISMYAYAVAWSGSVLLKIPLVPFPTGAGPTVSAVVGDLADEAGLTASDIETTTLTGNTVRGYSIASRMAARNALEPLMRTYSFDVIESDGKVKFSKRGGASVATIEAVDLGARPDGSGPVDPLNWRLSEERELARQIDLRYLDPAEEAQANNNYKVSVQTARRLVGSSQEVLTVEIPIVLTSTEARQIAQTLLYSTVVERAAIACHTSIEHLKLDPGDHITVVDGSTSRTLRLVKTVFTPPNRVELEALAEDVSVYTQFVAGVPLDQGPSQVIEVVPTILYLMDIPLLGEDQDAIGIYVGLHASYGTFTAAEVFESDDEEVYEPVFKTTAQVTAGAGVTTLSWEGAIL